jgi:hypothetical protein
MSGEVIIHGVQQLVANMNKREAAIETNKMRAAHSAANIFRKYIRLEARLIRGKGVAAGFTAKGKRKTNKHLLETRVVVVPVPGGYAAKDVAPHAHLVVHGHNPPSSPITPHPAWFSGGAGAKALSFAGVARASSPGGVARGNPFVHRPSSQQAKNR